MNTDDRSRSFTIEPLGSTVIRPSRAEAKRWEVDLANRVVALVFEKAIEEM
jgi:hypothetical protein